MEALKPPEILLVFWPTALYRLGGLILELDEVWKGHSSFRDSSSSSESVSAVKVLGQGREFCCQTVKPASVSTVTIKQLKDGPGETFVGRYITTNSTSSLKTMGPILSAPGGLARDATSSEKKEAAEKT